MAEELTGVFAPIDQPDLMEQYKQSEVLKALVQICWDSVVDLAPVAERVANSLSLDTSTGDQLDLVGGVFGVDREGRSDEDFRNAIYVRQAYQTSGTVDEIINACKKVFGATDIEYLPEYPGKFFMWLENATKDTSFANNFLNRIAPAGVQAMHGVNLVTISNPQPIHTISSDERIVVVKQDTV